MKDFTKLEQYFCHHTFFRKNDVMFTSSVTSLHAKKIIACKNNKVIKSSVGPISLLTTTKFCLTTRWSLSTSSGVVSGSCPSPIFWLSFGNRYTYPGEDLCQISHFDPEVNDFTQILASAPLLIWVFNALISNTSNLNPTNKTSFV